MREPGEVPDISVACHRTNRMPAFDPSLCAEDTWAVVLGVPDGDD